MNRIKNIIGIVLASWCAACVNPSATTETPQLCREVNPFIGTDFTGNTYPGAQAPHGMVQMSPDNGLPGWDRIAGYFYPDSTIAGFSHTHLSGTGAGDLYDISFLPVVEPLHVSAQPLGLHSMFSHDTEEAYAGYYRVALTDYDIDVELTATTRCGVQRYTFARTPQSASVVLNLTKAMNWDRTTGWHIQQTDSLTLTGYRFSDGWARNQKLFFCSRFSQPIRALQLTTVAERYAAGSPEAWLLECAPEQLPADSVAFIDFDLTASRGVLTVATALSAVSMEAAAANLQAELAAIGAASRQGAGVAPASSASSDTSRSLAAGGASADLFDTALLATEASWNEVLGKVQLKETDADRRTIFYTALYHALLAPTRYDDADGSYRGPDGAIHRTQGWGNYSTFSLWDTYRAAHPLYCLLEPERAADMARSILAFGEQLGRLPVWNMQASETDMMIGYHAATVLAEASLKGLLTPEEQQRALQLCVATANLDDYRGIGAYKRLGYVPADLKGEGENWNLSKSLEYAYDDGCIARLAAHLGDEATAETFRKRAANYRYVYNPQSGFMQPRKANGDFVTPFAPEEYTPYICESNAWHYLWSVQHDVEGLAELMGGKPRMEQMLDCLFTYQPREGEELPIFSTGMIGQYVHGNEPCHHVAYLYNYVGKPERTAHYVHRIMRELYTNRPDGLCGNEDCGQTSAWYVWSALGLYPVDPVTLMYDLGCPIHEEATVTLPGGRRLVVKVSGTVGTEPRVKQVSWNGRPLESRRINHQELMEGGVLLFEMDDRSDSSSGQ